MESSDLDKMRVCPHSPKIYYIVYDGGTTPELPVLICKSCSEQPLFQKFIKSKQVLAENSLEGKT